MKPKPDEAAAIPSAGPLVSVIVPVFEQWHLVPNLCHGLSAQSFPAEEFEVILVDNGSAVVAPPADLPAHARVIACPAPGSYAARNAGLAEARGQWLLFTDADCVPAPDWIAAHMRAAQETGPHTLLAGNIWMVASGPRPNRYEIYDLLRGIPQQRYVRNGYGATANLAVHRRVFEKVGQFDAARFSGGDAEFCRRAAAAGFGIRFVEAAEVSHPCRTSWDEVRTKVRRVRGGQVNSTSLRRHRSVLTGTLAPLALNLARFLRDSRHPLSYRLEASSVLLQVGIVEITESVRLALGGAPERR